MLQLIRQIQAAVAMTELKHQERGRSKKAVERVRVNLPDVV